MRLANSWDNEYLGIGHGTLWLESLLLSEPPSPARGVRVLRHHGWEQRAMLHIVRIHNIISKGSLLRPPPWQHVPAQVALHRLFVIAVHAANIFDRARENLGRPVQKTRAIAHSHSRAFLNHQYC